MAWPFRCVPPPDLTCRLPVNWMTSKAGPAVLARGFEKWVHLRAPLEPERPRTSPPPHSCWGCTPTRHGEFRGIWHIFDRL